MVALGAPKAGINKAPVTKCGIESLSSVSASPERRSFEQVKSRLKVHVSENVCGLPKVLTYTKMVKNTYHH